MTCFGLGHSEALWSGVPVTAHGIATLEADGVQNKDNAIGTPLAENSITNSANSARLRGGDVLTVILEHWVPPGTNIIISLARDNNSGDVTISDNSGATVDFDTGPNDRAQYINFVTGGVTDRLIFTRNSGRIWVDGLSYDVSDCDGDKIADEVDLDSDNDGILDAVECPTCAVFDFTNGDLEAPPISTTTFRLIDDDLVDGWNTTDPTGVIEFWSTNFQGVPSYSGNQFVELNANNPSILWQDFCAAPGTVLTWTVAHRGRDGRDVANVLIGSDSFTAVVQAVMSDSTDAWGVYTGTYTVPQGPVTNMVIAFEAVSTANNSLSIGNFIDGVDIEISCRDTDGDGVADYLDLDSDNDGLWDGTEAGHNVVMGADGRIPGADLGSGLNGFYDVLESLSESGIANYVLSDSEISPDGVYDPYQIDSDGDGCFDTYETLTDDPDLDGIAGTGVPSVDPATGLIIGLSYMAPTLNDRWQNTNINHCTLCVTATTNPHVMYHRRRN